MPSKFLVFLFFFFITSSSVIGQDTLPKFSVVNRGSERIIVSWTNPYDQRIRQLSIQRSFDSLKNYKTIMTVPDPTVLQNGYVDTKASTEHMFYRVYILLDSGKYLFSLSKRPGLDTAKAQQYIPIFLPGDTKGDESLNNSKSLERMIYIRKKDSIIGVIPERSLKTYREYLLSSTKDTVSMKSPDTLLIRPFVPKEFYRPSKYVFTEKDGNIRINLADANTRKYSVKFFEEDNTEIFEINRIKESVMILDKTNFYHSGWFNFEIYDDGKLKEKHKLFVPKDF